jgi:hypothetical protein
MAAKDRLPGGFCITIGESGNHGHVPVYTCQSFPVMFADAKIMLMNKKPRLAEKLL